MLIDILYFATLRDLIGKRKEKLEIPDGSTIGDLKGRLGERGDRIAQALSVALFSINREFAFAEEMLQEGDEVGIFPPVSGGAQPTMLAVTEDVLAGRKKPLSKRKLWAIMRPGRISGQRNPTQSRQCADLWNQHHFNRGRQWRI